MGKRTVAPKANCSPAFLDHGWHCACHSAERRDTDYVRPSATAMIRKNSAIRSNIIGTGSIRSNIIRSPFRSECVVGQETTIAAGPTRLRLRRTEVVTVGATQESVDRFARYQRRPRMLGPGGCLVLVSGARRIICGQTAAGGFSRHASRRAQPLGASRARPSHRGSGRCAVRRDGRRQSRCPAVMPSSKP